MAASAREDRDFANAALAFNARMYDRAETAFAQFVDKYPNSDRVAEAVLLQGQAELKQGKLAGTITLLTDTNRLARAGNLADAYVYWTGEAQFSNANYSGAAETWTALTQKFPGSPLRLPAVVGAASAWTTLAKWPQVVELLEATNSVFQRAKQADPGGEDVVRGDLLLAQAKFKLNDLAGASDILEPLLGSTALKPELGRQCALLFYEVKFTAGQVEAALSATTNLLQIARTETNGGWIAEGVALQAAALEKLGRVTEALAVYQENLTNAPSERQREAVQKIAELAIAQKLFPVATDALEKFLAQFPDSPSADIAQLTLAEMRLKDYAAQPSATNQLSEVQANLDRFINTFTNSPLLGRAYLDRGWCRVLAGNDAGSLDDFKSAAQKLPPSADLLVARFKTGDAQFAQGDFAGALENYRAVLNGLKLLPEADAVLGDLAWYQSLRASLELNDAAGAGNAFVEITARRPDGDLMQGSALLYGESLASPGEARALFEKLAAQLTNSPLQPQIGLAVAHTYERERDWTNAVTSYAAWLTNFPASDLRAQATYALAWAEYQAGDETNAFVQFTNFVTQFPTNTTLAMLAQWWVADHFFRADDFVSAEKNYKNIFQNPAWQGSPPENRTNLFYPAQLMAGRAAVARQDNAGAIRDFEKLEQDTNCPIELWGQATFEHGLALMSSDSAVTNNPLANFAAATNRFIQVVRVFPTNEPGALAWFYIGDCNVQLANYDAATNAYAQAFTSPAADISLRSRAQVGYGMALEKMAGPATGDDKRTLLELAKNNYLDVLFGTNLRDDEIADLFWVNKAGLQAALVVETLGEWEQAAGIYTELKKRLPQLGDLLDKKITEANAHLSQKN